MQMQQETIKINIETYLSQVAVALDKLPLEVVTRIIEVIDQARMKGARIYTFGNGGSAATASHFASDLSKGTICQGKPRIRAHALVDNMPIFSAWANDTNYDEIFGEQLENLVESGDIVIGISGSGNSANVLRGLEIAKRKGAFTVGLTGFEGGKLKDIVDISIIVPSNSMEQIEDVHLLLCHLITCCLRET